MRSLRHGRSDSADRRLSNAVAVVLMSVLLLLSAGAAFAFGEEGGDQPTGFSLPTEVDSAADLAPLIADSDPIDVEPDTDPVAAEELPHTDLNRAEAEDLLEGVFGADEIEAPAEFFDELHIEAFRTDNVALVAPAETGAEPGLLFSTLPLRTADDSGEEAPVDLGLEASKGSLEPSNPLVQVQIPNQLAEGISLPEAGVTVELAGGAVDRGASELGDASAFYPNVATDTDFVVAAAPTGFETYTHLRSPEAPTQQKFDLDVPAGAELRATNAGGAEVVLPDGTTSLTISAPAAIDAEGSDVPVTLEVEGDSVTLSTNPGPDAAFPILVDPIFDIYNFTSSTSQGTQGKPWVGAYTGKQVYYNWGSPKNGMNTGALTGPTTPGSNAWFNVYVPRYFTDAQAGLGEPTSYIKSLKLWYLTFNMPLESQPANERPAYPSMQMGLWANGQFAAYGERFGNQGQWTDLNYVFDLKNPNENTNVKNGGFGIATWASNTVADRYVNVQQASVELTDQDSPAFGSISSPSAWMNGTANGKINYVVSDPGLGIYALNVKQPSTEGGSQVISTSNGGCVGTAQTPCPRKTESATRTITYNPQSMAQGESYVEVTATDPVNHVSSPAYAKIKVDHNAPAISLSGSLTEQSTVGTNLPEYSLNYTAKDGDETAAAALSPFGTAGTGQGQIERPVGVAVADDGSFYVVDRINNRVVKYGKDGKFATQFGSTGSADGQFNDPRGIALAPDGTVYVADLGNDRIQAFSPTGAFLRKIKFSDPASQPYAIAVAPNGSIWVTDIGIPRVVGFRDNPVTNLGALYGKQSNPNDGGTDLASPVGVAVDKYSNVWVTDNGIDKVLEFDSNRKWKFQFGTFGPEPGQLQGPLGIDIAPSGNLAVMERDTNRVEIFKPDGTFLRQFGTGGSASGQFTEAGGLTFAPDNSLLVADAGNKRIARWSHVDQDPQSGVTDVEVRVDGNEQQVKTQTCGTKNCSLSSSWTLDADDFTGGAHKVEVVATDAVGISQTKTIDIETHGDHTDPTIALSGTMTQQASIGTTRPNYKLKAVATDPGPTEELKSGVASTVIKVDGVTVDSSSPGCLAGGCSITRQWTLDSGSYSVGSHIVEVKATDAVGRVSTKTLTIDIARDTTPPNVFYMGAFYSAPSGWLEQKDVPYGAYATDSGYGVTSVELKIDGAVVDSTSQPCSAGGCAKFFAEGETLDMAEYSGGAHPAEFIARDGAGNAVKRTWTINVDPEGHISASEAEDTLEALDTTSPVNTVGPSASEVPYEGTAEDLELQAVENHLLAQGSAAPVAVSVSTPGEFVVEVPTPTTGLACENREAEGPEESPVEQEEPCEEPLAIPTEKVMDQVTITPVGGIAGASQAVTPNAAAAVAQNVAPHVDLVTRPLYDGAMTFTSIRDAGGPQSFSWRVSLAQDQTLTLKSSKMAEVAYAGGHVAFTIMAIPAHDAVGTSVPTSLSVQGDVLTLSVDHKSGSFVYPVVGGAGWEGGFQTYQVVMPPNTEQSGEGGEESGSEYLAQGIYREATFGPPQTASGPIPLSASKSTAKQRRYKFSDCRFDANGGVQEPPTGAGGGVVKRENIVRQCHGEGEEGPNGAYFTISWAVSTHGHYEYEPQGSVWINKVPDCDKWGPDQPKKIACTPEAGALGKLFYPKMDLLSYYRFAPGLFGIGQGLGMSTCFLLDGVLPNRWVQQETGSNVLERTMHTYKEWKDPGDPCGWQAMTKID